MTEAVQRSTRIKELDALRGLAVLLVLINHFNHSWLTGGFIGVDVFFVLSGYVVSRSVLQRKGESLGQGLIGFYKRRFVRILPALIVCMLATTLISVLFIPRSWLSQSLEATGRWSIVGASNIAQIVTNDGYFAPTSEFNPFTHTWSLGIEEQFYILIPIFLILLRPRFVGWIVGFLSIVSVTLAFSWAETQQSLAFYSLFSRFWELGLGVLLALFYQKYFSNEERPSFKRLQRLSAVKVPLILAGLIVILCASIVQDSSVLTPWPGSLLPVAGAMLVIVSTYFIDSPKNKVEGLILGAIANPVLLWFGAISYALYLWHWPVVVLMKWTVGLDSSIKIAVGIALSIGLACLSTYLLELPLSRWSKGKTKLVMVMGLSSIVAGTFAVDRLFQKRSLLTWSVVNKNHYQWFSEAPIENSSDDEKPTIFAIGNSHALAYSPLLEAVHQRKGWNTRIRPLAHCTIGMIIHPRNTSDECEKSYRSTMRFLDKRAKPGDIVWLASLRMPRYVDQWGPMKHTPVEIARNEIYLGKVEEGAIETRELIRDLESKGLRVMIDRPKPVFKAPPFRCHDWFNRDNEICKDGFVVDRSEYDYVSQAVNQKIDQLKAEFPALIVWDPAEVLCDDQKCAAMDGANPVFFDADHLSRYGNMLLVDNFERKLNERLKTR